MELPYLVADLLFPCLAGSEATGNLNLLKRSSIAPLELPLLVADLRLPCLAVCEATGDLNLLKTSSIAPLNCHVW